MQIYRFDYHFSMSKLKYPLTQKYSLRTDNSLKYIDDTIYVHTYVIYLYVFIIYCTKDI